MLIMFHVFLLYMIAGYRAVHQRIWTDRVSTCRCLCLCVVPLDSEVPHDELRAIRYMASRRFCNCDVTRATSVAWERKAWLTARAVSQEGPNIQEESWSSARLGKVVRSFIGKVARSHTCQTTAASLVCTLE